MPQHPPGAGYVLGLGGCPQPLALGPAVLGPGAYAAGQSVGWVLHSNGSCGQERTLPSRAASIPLGPSMHSLPATGQHQFLPPALAAKAGRVCSQQVPASWNGLQGTGTPSQTTAAAAPVPAVVGAAAQAVAALARGGDGATCAPSPPASAPGWLQSSLASLAHLGRNHVSGSRQRQAQEAAQQLLGKSAGKSSCSSGTPDSAAAAAAAVAPDFASPFATAGAELQQFDIQRPDGSANQRSVVMQRYDSRAVRSTLEQAAAAVAAALPPARRGRGMVDTREHGKRPAMQTCPGGVVQLQHQPMPACAMGSSTMADAVSTNAAAHPRSSDHSPRARTHGGAGGKQSGSGATLGPLPLGSYGRVSDNGCSGPWKNSAAAMASGAGDLEGQGGGAHFTPVKGLHHFDQEQAGGPCPAPAASAAAVGQ
jgi:hypothetical protein